MNQESNGGISYRTWANSEYKYLISSDNINKKNSHNPKYFHVGFSNTCNFKCRSCNPSASCSIDKEFSKNIEKYPILNDSQNGGLGYNKESFINDKLLIELKENYHNIEVLHFHGGEPLLQPQLWDLLNFLIEKKRTNIKIQYNTNCSTLTYKKQNIFDILKHFKPENVMVQCSIDEVEERAELVRKGTNWKVVLNNVLTILNSNTCITLMGITASCLNVFRLPYILDYMVKHSMIAPKHHWTNFYVNAVDSPSHYSFAVLPDSLKKKTIKNINKICEKYKHFCDFKTKLLSIIYALENTSYDKELAKTFIQYTDTLDKIRGENTYETIPETKIIKEYALRN